MKKIICLILSILSGMLLFACCQENYVETLDYSNGRFYSLDEAYNNNYITYSDLEKISERNSMDPNTIGTDIQSYIRSAYFNSLCGQENADGEPIFPDADIEDINSIEYYGCYNGCYCVSIQNPYVESDDAIEYDIVEGVVITYVGAKRMLWVPSGVKTVDTIESEIVSGRIYSLDQAFRNEYIDDFDLHVILDFMRYDTLLNLDLIRSNTLLSIETTYAELNGVDIDEVYVAYYGNYKGCFAVGLSLTDYDEIEPTNGYHPRAEIVIWKSAENEAEPVIPEYKNGRFYTLHEAYNAGYITHENLVTIAEYINNFRRLDFGSVAEDTQMAIKNTYFQELCKLQNRDGSIIYPYADINDVTCAGYYGCYNGGYCVTVVDAYSGVITIMERDIIDGVVFYYSCGMLPKIWRATDDDTTPEPAEPSYIEGEFYSLYEAFDNGYITHDDLVDISKQQALSFSEVEDAIQISIKNTYFQELQQYDDLMYPYADINDISHIAYYGCYSDYYCVRI